VEKEEKSSKAFTSPQMKAERRLQLKNGMKVLHALSKYIKTSVEKDLIVDTLYFGSFLKS